MRYILGLLPNDQESEAYIIAAQEAFKTKTNGYLLTKEKSLPHVTLCSFLSDDEDLLSRIWKEALSWKITHCPVSVLGIMHKKGKIPPHHYSVGLCVARHPPLMHLHMLGMDFLNSQGLDSLNPSRDLYQPHITLAGISWPPSESVYLPHAIDKIIGMPLNPFRLALGRGDDIGQYLETLKVIDKPR